MSLLWFLCVFHLHGLLNWISFFQMIPVLPKYHIHDTLHWNDSYSSRNLIPCTITLFLCKDITKLLHYFNPYVIWELLVTSATSLSGWRSSAESSSTPPLAQISEPFWGAPQGCLLLLRDLQGSLLLLFESINFKNWLDTGEIGKVNQKQSIREQHLESRC